MTDLNHAIVITTTDNAAEAKSLAKGIVTERLAACVQETVISSTYWWDGEVESADEFLLLCKTTKDRVEALTSWVLANHSYDTPEVVELPIEGGSDAYLAWITANTR